MPTIMMDPKILKNNLNNISIYGDSPGDELIESVRAHGVLEALTVDRDSKIIISGHRRRGAAVVAGLNLVPVNLIELPDADEQLQRLIESNRHREKTNEQKTREYTALLKVEQRLAEARKAEAGGDKKTKKARKMAKQPGSGSVSGNSPKRSGKAKDKAAEQVGMSAKTADQAAEVVKEIDQAQADGDQARADELRETLNAKSVAAASRKVKEAEEYQPFKEDPKTDAQRVASYLIKELGKVEREFKRLVVEEDGNENNWHKIAHLSQNAQEFLTKLRNAKAVLQVNKPHSECSFCKGAGKVKSKACEKCHESGWLTKRQVDMYGEE